MSHYHNNQLTMVSLDSDIDDAPYTPTKSAKNAKRKRSANCTTRNVNNKPGKNMTTDVSLDSAAGVHALDDSVGSPMSGTSTYQVPHTLSAFSTYSPQTNGLYLNYDYNDPSLFSSNMWDQAPVGHGFENPFNQDAYESADPILDDALHDMNHEEGDHQHSLQNSHDGGLHLLHVEGDVDGRDDNIEVKAESGLNNIVSPTPYGDSDYDESDYDERRPSKNPKLNKDGIPRKPRQPRPKLLKWDDHDWKNVALGLVWACGENGIQIPFDQASQIVSESCTAGALQQALLKLRGKQIAEGFQIPSLRMAWTRKNKIASSSTSSANTKSLLDGTTKNMLPKKKPTRFVGCQSLIVTLKRAYVDADRYHLGSPYKPARSSYKMTAPAKTSFQPRAQGAPYSATNTQYNAYMAPFGFGGNPTPATSPTNAAPTTPTKKSHSRKRHNSVSHSTPMKLSPICEGVIRSPSSPRSWSGYHFPATIVEEIDRRSAYNFTIESPKELEYDIMPNASSGCQANGLGYYPGNGFGPGDDGFGSGLGGAFNSFPGDDVFA